MIESGEESQVAIAFFLGAGVMAVGGLVELVLGVKAEGRELEQIARPLTAQDEEPARPRRAYASPGMAVATPVGVVALDREIAAITRVVAERGPTERRELARLVGARFWGPGRFSVALAAAVRAGEVRRVSRTRYGAVDETAAG